MIKHHEMVELLLERCDVGVATEAGELLDALKKHVFYNKPLDMENVTEELGDIEFYLQGLRARLNIARADTLQHNVDKLLVGEKARYKDGYTDEAAQLRRDKA